MAEEAAAILEKDFRPFEGKLPPRVIAEAVARAENYQLLSRAVSLNSRGGKRVIWQDGAGLMIVLLFCNPLPTLGLDQVLDGVGEVVPTVPVSS